MFYFSRKLRTAISSLFIISLLINVGMWLELQRVWVLLMIGTGLVGAILTWLAFLMRPRSEDEPGAPVLDHPGGEGYEGHSIPPLMWVIYVATAAFMVGYMAWAMLVHPNL